MQMVVTYWNLNGRIIGEVRNGVMSHYFSDPEGNVTSIVDATGHVTDTMSYYPFGEIASRTGTNPTPFLYRGALGYFTDKPSGRMYVRARHYRPNLARWQTVDPLWPTQPAYEYAQSDPISNSDQSGTEYFPGCADSEAFPIANRCNICADAILNQWWHTAAHFHDHQYAHCMACCVLNNLDGPNCAVGKQQFQNYADFPKGWGDLKERNKRVVGRTNYCEIGIGIAPPHGPQTSCGACDAGCQKEFPLPAGIAPLPCLNECDPQSYKPRPGGFWVYCRTPKPPRVRSS